MLGSGRPAVEPVARGLNAPGVAGSLNDDGGGIMSVIFVALGILVAFVLGVVLPWALLRKLEHGDTVKED